LIDQNFFELISTNPSGMNVSEPDGLTMRVHWTCSRKAALVAAVAMGKISLDEAQRRYRLSDEEFASWVTALEKNGAPGLRATRFQVYRDKPRLRQSGTRNAEAVTETAGFVSV
jgi:Protein of unknown function (DUF1153)